MTPKDHVLFETTAASNEERCWLPEEENCSEEETDTEEARKMGPQQNCGLLLLRRQRTTVSVQTCVAHPKCQSGWHDDSSNSNESDEDNEETVDDDDCSSNNSLDSNGKGNESVSDEEGDFPFDTHHHQTSFTITAFLELDKSHPQHKAHNATADLYGLCSNGGPFGGFGLESIEELEENRRREIKQEEDEKLFEANLHRRCIQFSERPQIQEYEGIPLDLYKDVFYSCHQLQHFIEEANAEESAEALLADV